MVGMNTVAFLEFFLKGGGALHVCVYNFDLKQTKEMKKPNNDRQPITNMKQSMTAFILQTILC